jgi:small subunit ribosomal protein S1
MVEQKNIRKGTMMTEDPDFESMLDMSEKKSQALKTGEKVTARVIRIGRDYVFLDLGSRAEGLLAVESVPKRDGDVAYAVGDKIGVFVTAIRDGAILCGLSVTAAALDVQKKDNRGAVNAALKEAFESGMPVEGSVKEVVKGGFSVMMMGSRAFCPVSQIDKVYCEKPEDHVNQTYRFLITKFEEDGRNIVVTRRRILEREAEEVAKEMWQKIVIGQVYTGKVTSVKPYGAFVDIGGLEGLIHVSEMGFDKTQTPESMIEAGAEVTVAVKDVDPKKGRISLSLKALMEDPWNTVKELIKPEQVIAGRVTRTADFGAFVQLLPGIEGLVHISAMVKDRRIRSPLEVVQQGKEVMVRVLDIDPALRRISLSMVLEKEDQEDWKESLAEANVDRPTGFGTLGDVFSKKAPK